MMGLQTAESKLGRIFWYRRDFLVNLNGWLSILPIPETNLGSQPLKRVLREAEGHKACGTEFTLGEVK